MYSRTIPSERESQRVLTAGYVGCVEKDKNCLSIWKMSSYSPLKKKNLSPPPWGGGGGGGF